MKKIFRYILFVVNAICALALIGAVHSPYVDPADNWLWSLLGFAYPYLIIINASFIFLWIFVYWRYVFLSMISLISGFQTFNSFYSFSVKQSIDSSEINVFSYNVRHFYSFLEKRDSTYNMLDFIAEQNADIICLQETKLQKNGPLNPLKLKKLFPGIVHCQLAHQSTWGGPVTFTRFPILDMGEIRFDSSANLVIYTDIKTPIDTLRIYNCHLQSYQFSNNVLVNVKDSLQQDPEKIQEAKSILHKLKLANIKRSQQVKKLRAHIEQCEYPVILCGDFNDIPSSYTYRQINQILNDAFVHSGQGTSNTYQGNFPSFRIDYIFYSDEFESYNYKRLKNGFSDHYAIRCGLNRKN